MTTSDVSQSQPGRRTWKATTAGILSVVAGALNVIIFTIVAVAADVTGSMLTGFWGFGAIGIPGIAVGIIAIVGGVFALKRRVWGLALAGAICALVPGFILGILAIIFVSLGKDEFAAVD